MAVKAVNSLGDEEADPATFTWTRDTSPAATPAITSAPAASTTDRAATFAFGAPPGAQTATCDLDGVSATCNSGTVSYSSLTLGTYRFKVRFCTAAGLCSAWVTRDWEIVQAQLDDHQNNQNDQQQDGGKDETKPTPGTSRLAALKAGRVNVKAGKARLSFMCDDPDGCTAMKLTLTGKGLKLKLSVPAVAAGQSKAQATVKLTAKQVKALKKARKGIRLTVTGPAGFKRTSLTFSAR